MTTSKISKINPRDSWTTQRGDTMWTFAVELEDGTRGDVNARSEDPWWGIGTEVAYTVNGSRNGISKLKFDRPEFAATHTAAPGSSSSQSPSGSEVGKRILSCWALDTALRLHEIEQGSNAKPGQVSVEYLGELAIKILEEQNKIQSKI